MGCNKICKTCEHSNPSRVKDGMIRCLKRHIFVPLTHTCDFHSFHFTMDDAKLKELWYLSCRTLGISQFGLNTEDFDLAVEDAKAIIQTKLEMLSQNFAGFLSDDTENKIVRY